MAGEGSMYSIFLEAAVKGLVEYAQEHKSDIFSSLIRRKATPATFKEYQSFSADFADRLSSELKHEERKKSYSAVRAMALANTLSITALALARRVITDKVPIGMNAQIYIYDEKNESLVMWLSSGVQSFRSVDPWPFGEDNRKAKEGHKNPHELNPGICVRVFHSGNRIVKRTMEGFEQRQGETICGMISEPIIVCEQARNHDIAALNIVSRTPNKIPEALNKDQLERLVEVKRLLIQINNVNRLLHVGWASS